MSLKDKLTIVISVILFVTLIFISVYLYLDIKIRIESENFRAGVILGDMIRSVITSEKSVTEKVFMKIPIEKWDEVWNIIRTKIFLTLPVKRWCIFKPTFDHLACSELIDMDILNLLKDTEFRTYFMKNEPRAYKSFFVYPITLYNNNLMVVFQIPQSIQKSISTPQRVFYLTFSLLIFNFITIYIILRLLLHRYVLKPLSELLDASIQIQNKNFDIKVRVPAKKDEIGHLMNAFATMAENIKNHNQLLEGKIAEVTKKFEELNKELVLSQRLTTTGIMVSGIAHEINNPLGALINAAYLLKNRNDVDEQTYDEYIKLIIEGLFRIKDIVRRILQFSPRYQKNIKSPESLASILDDSLTFARYRAIKRGINIINEVTAEKDFIIKGNRSELQQVFLNLIINALDAMEEKGSTLKIYAQYENEQFVKVFIEDDGIGMDEETQKNIFNPFFTTKDPGKGTGLGLYIVQYVVVNQHRGKIYVESRKNQGTKFTLLLPRG